MEHQATFYNSRSQKYTKFIWPGAEVSPCQSDEDEHLNITGSPLLSRVGNDRMIGLLGI